MRRLAAVLVVVLAAAGCGDDGGDDAGDDARTDGGPAVQISDFAFAPPELTIQAGETVTWTNEDEVSHTVTATGFDSGSVPSGEQFATTFDAPGEVRYVCTIHPTMAGTIVVTA